MHHMIIMYIIKKHSFWDLKKTTFNNVIKLQILFNINLKWGNEQTIIYINQYRQKTNIFNIGWIQYVTHISCIPTIDNDMKTDGNVESTLCFLNVYVYKHYHNGFIMAQL